MTARPDPQHDAGRPRSGPKPDGTASGLRVLCVSVRGHRYLVGGPTVHPVDSVPAGAGRRFASAADVERYVRHELRGIRALRQVEVVDDDGVVLRRGTRHGIRRGRNGTGERWIWQQV